MLIAILNQSTVVANADVATMTEAIATQIQFDVAPIWDRAPAAVVFYTDPTAVPAAAYGIAVVDAIQDQPQGVLGFHTGNQVAQMWGVVAAQPELTNNGQVLTGDWSVSSTLSHEVLETFIDRNCNLWANDGNGSVYSLEVCDPVEAPTYTVSGVSVCNFVTPSWFDPLAPAGAQFDKLGQLTAPFSILPGGYMTFELKGKEQQQWGTNYPGWRKAMKTPPMAPPGARSQRRVLQASYHL
jgi:hypothetical protein